MRKFNLYIGIVIPMLIGQISCVFNFDVPSAKTSLEQQVLGEWQIIDDELLLLTTSRGKGARLKIDTASLARKNQLFNKDDIEFLKNKGILGESLDVKIIILPTRFHLDTDKSMLTLARTIAYEENRDRKVIWNGTLRNKKQTEKVNLELIKSLYFERIKEGLTSGQWYQNSNKEWKQKP